MLSEISQTENDEYHMTSFVCGIQQTKQETNSYIQRTDWYLPEVTSVGVKEMGEEDQRYKKL